MFTVTNPTATLINNARRYNGDDVTDYARECLKDGVLLFDNIGELDRRVRYAGGKIGPKHTFLGQNLGGLFGMKKVGDGLLRALGVVCILSCCRLTLHSFPFVD